MEHQKALQQNSKIRDGAAVHLQAARVVRQPSDLVHRHQHLDILLYGDMITACGHLLLADGVVAAGVVVRRVLLTGDHLVR